MRRRARRSRIGLASPDADGVVPLRDDRIPFLGDHPEVTRLQLEVHLLTRARIEVDALESTESDAGSSLNCRKLEIELHDLVSRNLACVGHSHIGAYGVSRGNALLSQAQVAVTELRVAEAVTERIKRLAGEVAVGPVRHTVVFEVGQLVHARVERKRKPTCGVVFSA